MALLRVPGPARAMRRGAGRGIASLIAPVLFLSSAPQLSAEAAISAEYQVKAVFLFNFAQFVEWPPKAFPDPQTPLIIGILGDDPFDGYLDETVRGEKAKIGHSLCSVTGVLVKSKSATSSMSAVLNVTVLNRFSPPLKAGTF